ncbi:MAG: hypothetical protein AVDCRST_MAG59-149 [uncultured Thermomicrobiales bacterium]|uniref:Methyltransferase domain-containing protein n=1 Tax=uncultured Thermomicrobiales bacterium TaxID=1645740 RepID=A0A6J4TX33_9BACT|nr:MAG: hypothetical protein AVDCRST_MAG59-149 [uncultured Thermomicrobiales bacterium]
MRIVIVDPLLTGDVSLAEMLRSIYGLATVVRVATPRRAGGGQRLSVEQFPSDAVSRYSGPPADETVSVLADAGAHVIALLRDPYDAFVAVYRGAQSEQPTNQRQARKRRSDVMVGKPIDHPDVLGFLSHEFPSTLSRTTGWLLDADAVPVRLEDLEADPASVLRTVSDRIAPVAPGLIAETVAAWSATPGARPTDATRDRPRHVRRAAPVPVGESRQELGDAHYALSREHLADHIVGLEYEVRQPSESWVAAHPTIAAEVTDAGADLIAPAELRRFRYARRGGKEGFVRVGDEVVRRFVDLCGLEPDERILDVGCGVGRIALALTKYLDERARYDGFDVDTEGIRWCQEQITPSFPNFRFQLADVFSKNYHPDGRYQPSEYRFPFPDASFSFVFLTSVFTHLVPEAAENYLRQIARVLEHGGRCYCTWNLLTPESLDDLEQGRGGKPFPVDHGFYRLQKADNPERSIAYAESWVRETIATVGLSIDQPIHHRGWSRQRHADQGNQDIVVATKRA